MSIQIVHKVVVQMALDTPQKRKLFFQTDDATAETAIATLDKQSSGNIAVAVSSTESLTFGDLTDVRGFYLEVSGDCNLRINGSLDDIPVKVAPGGSAAKVLMEVALTTLTIENPSASTELTGMFVVWGDPTP